MIGASEGGGKSPTHHGVHAAVLTVLFLVVAGLIFYAIYVAFPQDHEFNALLGIGALSLVFALACYLLEAASRDPAAQRSLAWAFLAMGFSTLFLTVGLGPTYGVESAAAQLGGLIVLLLFLGLTVGLVSWRLRSVEAEEHRDVARQTWRQESPASAFSYAAAQSPSVPSSAPAPTLPGSEPPAGGP